MPCIWELENVTLTGILIKYSIRWRVGCIRFLLVCCEVLSTLEWWWCWWQYNRLATKNELCTNVKVTHLILTKNDYPICLKSFQVLIFLMSCRLYIGTMLNVISDSYSALFRRRQGSSNTRWGSLHRVSETVDQELELKIKFHHLSQL